MAKAISSKPATLLFLLCALGPGLGPLKAQGLPPLDSIIALEPEAETSPVTASLAFDVSQINPGAAFTALISLEHAPGWHSYGPDPGEAGLPTTIEWNLPEGLSAGPIQWPPTRVFDDRGVKSRGYSGSIDLKVELRADRKIQPGTSLRIGAVVRWLACKEACIPGEARFEYALPAGLAAGPPARPASNALKLILAVLGAFLGGLILNLMPCVLPVLSLKLHGLILQSGATRRISVRNGLAYALGVLISFWALALLLIALKAGGRAIGWGFQFQDPRFVSVMAAFFLAFALNMLGLFEIGAGAAAAANGHARPEGFPRAFFSGILATAAATPCTAPFMGAAIGFALSSSPAAALLVFSALGLGLASPIVILSAFPALASRLPKAGRWTETLKHILGFGLLGTVVWMLSILIPLAGPGFLVRALVSLLGTALSAWILGRWGGLEFATGIRAIARVAALIVFAGSLAFLILQPLSARSSDSTFPARPENPEGPSGTRLSWQDYDPALLSSLRAQDLPVFIDFTADWCLSCKANELAVLNRQALVDAFAQRGVAALRADWTRADPLVTKALAEYGRSSVPLYLLYLPGADAPLVLPEILTTSIMMKALAKISE